MAGVRYDSEWKEVRDINARVLLRTYSTFAFRGLGILVVTWTTVVLLGGFVSMIDKPDFWNLTVITLVELLWIDESFIEKLISARDLYRLSMRAIRDLFTGTDKARADYRDLTIVKRVVAVVSTMAALAHGVILCSCIFCMFCFMIYGLYITTCISISGLMEHSHYGDTDEDRINMDPAHKVLYALCLAQVALNLHRLTLTFWLDNLVKQVSQAYGFPDGDCAVWGYCREITKGCWEKPSSVSERNLITYAVELMESRSALSYDFLTGILILDRLLTRQHSHKTIKPPNLMEEEEEEEEEEEATQQQQQQQFYLGEEIPLIKNENMEESNKTSQQHQQTEKKIIIQQRTIIKRLIIRSASSEEIPLIKDENMEESNKTSQQHQQTEKKIIIQQRAIIKRLIIRSASSADILQKLLQTLASRRSDDKKMREAAARVVEHVADGICLGQFPQGIWSISALINTFEEYHRLRSHQPSSWSNTNNDREKGQGNTLSSESDSEYSVSESELARRRQRQLSTNLRLLWRLVTRKDLTSILEGNGMDRPSSDDDRSKTNPFHGYKELVMTGLRILWSLAGNEENCTIISNTEHLVSKIMAPASYDLVHRAGHSAWSTMVSERSLGVMLRLIVTAKGDTRDDLGQQISSDKGAITTMERIVTCEECKGGELQMMAMKILTQLCMDEPSRNRGNLTKMLASIFTDGDSCDGSIRRTAGEMLVMLFLSSKSVGTLLPKEENNEFVGDLANILLQLGGDDTCRRVSAEILEHLCIHYTENEQYLNTLKDTMTGLMAKVLREILYWLAGEERNSGYAGSGTDVESQVTTDIYKNSNRSSSVHGQNQHHKLHIALLSLCAAACDKLHLDLDGISLGWGDQARDRGKCVVFSLAMRMVQLNRDVITTDNLKAMKLITRMVIAAMKKLTDHDIIVERADLASLMDSLTSISETMLDLEGSMVFAARTTAVPATADTLDSLVKQARQLHIEIKDQESEINVS